MLWPERGRVFGTFLQFGLGRWQVTSGHGIGKSAAIVRSVAKRLVARVPATAQLKGRPSGEAEDGAGGVADFEVALYQKWSVVQRRDLGGRHSLGS